MQFIEFPYETEDGILVTVFGQGRIVHQLDEAADFYNPDGYPIRNVTNVKFKCIQENGSKLSNELLSEDDQTRIEDFINNNLEEESETESDFYNRYDD